MRSPALGPTEPPSPVYDAFTAVDIHMQEGDPPDWACVNPPDQPPRADGPIPSSTTNAYRWSRAM